MALWFLESFGLTLDSVKVTDKDGKITDLDYGTDDRCSKTSFHNLSQEGQDTVSSLLYIMDNFCVGDAAYHERENGDLGKQQVEISGDGAKMLRIANFIVISFALLSDGENVMSCKGNHTVGIVSGSEDYDVLNVSCKDIFAEINELVHKGEIEVDGHKVPLEFYLSGDYKFLLLVLGMNSACADYASGTHLSQKTITGWMGIGGLWLKNRDLAKKSSNNYGCIRFPLLDIPIENTRVDELHLLL
ncbi:hypothetical protein OS493_006876 [Desmophyllum pertusum]|uniref:Uncharacterized protein n=1 Tax=Desmophyllum pertusum TaxID=174260 RepID=A0A9X0D544_9CNID|nr:hypothetical protein OS493_006876 [Desmophyllum pertusum]